MGTAQGITSDIPSDIWPENVGHMRLPEGSEAATWRLTIRLEPGWKERLDRRSGRGGIGRYVRGLIENDLNQTNGVEHHAAPVRRSSTPTTVKDSVADVVASAAPQTPQDRRLADIITSSGGALTTASNLATPPPKPPPPERIEAPYDIPEPVHRHRPIGKIGHRVCEDCGEMLS